MWSATALKIRLIVIRGEVRADAEVRTGATEADVWIGVTQDVERVRVIEDFFVEVG